MSDYSITVDTETYSLGRGDTDILDIIPLGSSQYHLLRDHKSYNIEVLETDFPNKKITISVNGNTYSVNITDEFDRMVEKMGMRDTRSHQISEIRAPMPGLILDVLATVGQMVDKGTPLIVLSAMKMENIITSPGAGSVKKIMVETNKAVEKGELIIEME